MRNATMQPALAAKTSRKAPMVPIDPEPAATALSFWGKAGVGGDLLMVPRTLLRLGQYEPALAKQLRPRHLLLLLALVSRKYRDKPIRAYWEELAEDLGESKETVRKWAYQIRDAKLLTIRNHRGRDPARNRPGLRNERNSFDLTPFVAALEKAWGVRRIDRDRRRADGAE